MTNTEVINATNIPTIKIINSRPVKANPNLTSFSKDAPNITGIAKKNVNSAATLLLTPSINAPTIVAPLLLEPDEYRKYSGQFKLRLPKDLHKKLYTRAREQGISMNTYCIYLLAKNSAIESLSK